MKKYIAAVCCILFLASTSYAGQLDRKIKKLIKPFVESVQVGESVTVAVFTFQTDEKLAKKRVNFAVSELLTQELHQTGIFKLVERSQLDAVLKEQKLGISGAVDSKTAAELGRLLGAGQIILGSVSKLGRSYQINARLVDSETGEIIAPSIVEVPITVFDEEANRYLTLVPDKQTIGLQIVLMDLPCKISASPAQRFDNTLANIGGDAPATFTATPRVTMGGYKGLGLGIRYFPTSWLALEGTYFLPSEDTVMFDLSDGGAGPPTVEYQYSRKAMRFGAEYIHRMSEKLRLYGGIQVLMLWVENAQENAQSDLVTFSDGGYNFRAEGIDFTVTALRLGVEWRPQARIGLSLFGSLALGASEKTVKANISERKGPTMTEVRDVDFFTVKYPALSFEAAFTFYF